MSTDALARGLAQRTAANLASKASDQGAALLGYRHGAATAVGRTAQDKLRETVSVRDFGAKGDGISDDTAAIQAAINAVFSINGGTLYFPNGTYKISAKLVIPFATGWRIKGQSRGGTIIRQFTANTRIFSLESDLTHSWEISDFTFDWSVQQTVANTQAVALFIGTGAPPNGGMFNWQVRRCNFNKGFRSIAGDSTNSPPLWGVHVANCNHGGTMAGAFFFASPSPSVGQPNICLESCLIDAAGAGEATIRISAGDNVVLRSLEFLNGSSANPLMDIATTFAVSLIGCKTENYDGGTNSPALWNFSQCNVRVISCSCNGLLGSAGNPKLISGSNSTLSIVGLTCGSAMTGGMAIAYTAATIALVSDVVLTGLFSDKLRTYLGLLAMPKLDADKRQPDWMTEPGDASVMLTASSDRIQYYAVTLTANRTVTLPSTGLYAGMEFEVVRKTATPGAFTLTVVDPVSGNNYAIAASTNGYVRYRYGSAWRIMRAGTM